MTKPTKLDRLRALMASKDPPMSRKDACRLLGYDPNDPELIDTTDMPEFFKDLFNGTPFG